MASYPAPSENLSVFTPSLFNSLTDVGPGIQFENGTIQTTAYTGGGGGSQTLAQTLVLGNSAGASSINMNNQNITSVNTITATGDLTLNPVGSISCNGKTLDMTNGEIHNTPLIHSQNNSNITIEAKGTGIVILKGNNANTQIQSTGLTTVPTLQVQDTTTTREVDIYTNSTASNQNPIVQANDTTIIGKGTTLTNGVIDIATNSATTSGIRITNNTALIGAGGTSATPSHYFQSDPTNSLNNINGNTKITGNCEVTGTFTSPSVFPTPYTQSSLLYYCNSGTKTGLQNSSAFYPTSGGIIIYSPFYVYKTMTGVNRIAIRNLAQPNTITLHMGIYSSNPVSGEPQTLLISGNVALSTAGAANIINPTTPSSITLNRGYYWTAFLPVVTSGTAPTNNIDAILSATLTLPDMIFYANINNANIVCHTYVSNTTPATTTSLPATATGLITKAQIDRIPLILVGIV